MLRSIRFERQSDWSVSSSYTEDRQIPFVPRSRNTLNYLDRMGAGWSRFLAWLVCPLSDEQQRLLGFAIVAGGLCGLAAVAFHVTIAWLESLLIDPANHAPGHSWIVWTIISPALGGLIVGLGLTYWAPAAAGSGIPQVKAAFALRYGLIS